MRGGLLAGFGCGFGAGFVGEMVGRLTGDPLVVNAASLSMVGAAIGLVVLAHGLNRGDQ